MSYVLLELSALTPQPSHVILLPCAQGEGGILCGCEECNGRTEVPPSVFEEHSGSLAKKPADNIFVLSYGVSLKVGGDMGLCTLRAAAG